MPVRTKWPKVFVYLIICHITAVCLFLIGFLPPTNKNVDYADWSHPPSSFSNSNWNPDDFNNPKLKRAVLIVIDALRADFIINDNLHSSMPFLHSLHEKNEACSYLSRAHTPTVTLPRIKAAVTGSVPGFSDVIFNLGSSELAEDNILHQLVDKGHDIVFYGDDTWLSLFPDKFVRSEGTTSFFVNDYTEVDHNVTRNLDFELNRTDWSVMILHYLGLDHIGHVSGPRSPLIPAKLKEMDDVIHKIYDQFKGSDTGIIICGDHGMSDSGSHGGSSPSETDIPLTFVIDGCLPSNKSSLQIDLVPTLSMLMGVPIPSNSLGSLLEGILSLFEPIQVLHAAYFNAHTVARQFENFTKNYEDNSDHQQYERGVKMYQDLLAGVGRSDEKEISDVFFKATEGMSAVLIESLVKFDLYLMLVGILLLLQILLISTFECGNLVEKPPLHPDYLITIIVTLLFTVCNVVTCVSINNNSLMCANGHNHILFTVFLNGLVLAAFSINGELICRNLVSGFSVNTKRLGNIPECFLTLGTVLHCASLSSSSFVEEEHQTYYFLTTTLTFLLMWHRMDSNSWKRNIAVLILLRITRGWNQTGDKWITQPDIEDWLNSTSHRTYLTLSSFCGVVGIYSWIISTQVLNAVQKAAAALGLVGILIYRAAIGTISFHYPESKGISEAALTYLCILFITLAARDRLSGLITSWILLTSLLKRPHNLMLTWLQLVQYSLLKTALSHQLRPFHQALAFYWIGMTWYFHQGNANSLARIDVAAGYVGLSDYHATTVGFLLLCATYSGPVLSLLLSVQDRRGNLNLQQYFNAFLWSRSLIITGFILIVTLLRNHLFIWTVFSPKLLYEATASCVIFLTLFVLISIKTFC